MFYHPNMILADFKDCLRELAPLQYKLEELSLQCLQLTETTIQHIRMVSRDWCRANLRNHPLKRVLVGRDPHDVQAVYIEFQYKERYQSLFTQLRESDLYFDLMEGFVPNLLIDPVSIDPALIPPLPSFLVPPAVEAPQEPEPLSGWNDNPFG